MPRRVRRPRTTTLKGINFPINSCPNPSYSDMPISHDALGSYKTCAATLPHGLKVIFCTPDDDALERSSS